MSCVNSQRNGEEFHISVNVIRHTECTTVNYIETHQVRDASNPLPAPVRILAVLDALHNVASGLVVTILEPLLEVDPTCVLFFPVGAPAVVVFEVVQPPLAVRGCVDGLVGVRTRAVLKG